MFFSSTISVRSSHVVPLSPSFADVVSAASTSFTPIDVSPSAPIITTTPYLPVFNPYSVKKTFFSSNAKSSVFKTVPLKKSATTTTNKAFFPRQQYVPIVGKSSDAIYAPASTSPSSIWPKRTYFVKIPFLPIPAPTTTTTPPTTTTRLGSNSMKIFVRKIICRRKNTKIR